MKIFLLKSFEKHSNSDLKMENKKESIKKIEESI